ncbi:hypothetical protein EVAR_98972_1 [Eumeta japonica]|uniref:Uncharacterized protein n=1 Tax=Eumeta variegata TaxID=151549 RepID=A0A4C1YS86_EUMVA|nr:hypothetical protein EVAR_98972_1 [Eumeta japonica]
MIATRGGTRCAARALPAPRATPRARLTRDERQFGRVQAMADHPRPIRHSKLAHILTYLVIPLPIRRAGARPPPRDTIAGAHRRARAAPDTHRGGDDVRYARRDGNGLFMEMLRDARFRVTLRAIS